MNYHCDFLLANALALMVPSCLSFKNIKYRRALYLIMSLDITELQYGAMLLIIKMLIGECLVWTVIGRYASN